MAKIPFSLLEEPETRKPSKVHLAFFIVILLLLVLSAAFIALYIKEKSKSTDSSSGKTQLPTYIPELKTKPTYIPYSETNPTRKEWNPTQAPSPQTGACTTAACVTSAAGIHTVIVSTLSRDIAILKLHDIFKINSHLKR